MLNTRTILRQGDHVWFELAGSRQRLASGDMMRVVKMVPAEVIRIREKGRITIYIDTAWMPTGCRSRSTTPEKLYKLAC